MKYGCRAHDLGRFSAAELAARLRRSGCNAAQLTLPKAILGIDSFKDIRPDQLEAVRTAFSDVEISVLGCYQDLSSADEEVRLRGVDAICRCLGYAKAVGAKVVGSESACRDLTHEEKLAAIPRMTDSVLRIVERAAALDAVFALEPVFNHVFYSPEVLDTLLRTVGDDAHCKVIFDPVNVLTAERVGHQEAHWQEWTQVIGGRLAAMHIKDARFPAGQPRIDTPLGEGQMDYRPLSAWLRRDYPDIALLRDEVIPAAFTADMAFLRTL